MTLVCFALPFESEGFRRQIRHRADITVIHTGIGSHAAAAAFRQALNSCKPDRVIASGFCGALDPNLRVGDPLIGTNVSTAEAVAYFQGSSMQFGKMLMSPEVIASTDHKRQLWISTGARSVDMESAALFAVASELDVPILTLRVVSDDAAHDLVVPGAILAGAAEGGLSGILRLAAWLLQNPGKWSGFIRMLRDSKVAQRSLANHLFAVISAPARD